MPWSAALRDAAKAGLQLDRSLTDPRRAVRGALAAALVIFPALALGGPAPATSAAMGAFIGGTATFQRSFRPRASLAVATGIGLGVSTFLGYLAVGIPGAFLVLLALWAFGAGMAWAIGPVSGVVASNTLAVMLVVVQLPVSVPAALGHGLLCSLGGAVQALVVTCWPIGSWRVQRDALADTYAELADLARRLRADPLAGPNPEPFMLAREAAAVTPWQEKHRPPELHGLRGIAERIRPALTALADPRVGAPAEGPGRDRAREVLAAAAEALDTIAHAIRTGEPLHAAGSTPALTLAKDPEGERLTGPARRSAHRIAGLLRSAVNSLDGQDEDTVTTTTIGPVLRRPSIFRMAPVAGQAVRRQLQPHSVVSHHAVRLAGVVTTAYLASRLLGLHHGYWAPMTAAMVMRPDFGQTFSRGIARVAGTVVGVALSTAVVELLHPGHWLSASLAVLCMCGAYLTMRTGYALMTVCVSSYVVFLLGLQHGHPLHTAAERVALTLLGGAVALAAYALFPSWQTARLTERSAEWLAAAGRYTAAVLTAFGYPAGGHNREVREALLDSREARTELLAALQRADAEPVRHEGQQPDLSRKQLDKARTAILLLARCGVLLEAHLPPADADPVPGAGDFAEELKYATAIAAAAVLIGQTPEFSTLRKAYATWDAELAALPPGDRTAVTRAGAKLVMQAVGDLEKAVRPRTRMAQPRPTGDAGVTSPQPARPGRAAEPTEVAGR